LLGDRGSGIGTCPPLAVIGAHWIACIVLYAKTVLAAGKAKVAVLTPRCACVEMVLEIVRRGAVEGGAEGGGERGGQESIHQVMPTD